MIGNTRRLRQVCNAEHLIVAANLLNLRSHLKGDVTANADVDFVEYQRLIIAGVEYGFERQRNAR